MNKIYKIIWSDARKCYVVVAEIAKNRGKNNVRTIVEGLSAHALVRAGRWALPFVAAGALLLPVSAWATTITPKSGVTNNVFNTKTGVYDVYAQEITTDNAFGVSRFQSFSLDNGHIANMYFKLQNDPANVNTLVNLVQNRIDVKGTVNAIKSGKIDGNLFFISPNGMTLGPSGVINAGSFTALAPTSDYFDKLWGETNVLADQLDKDLKNFGKRDDKGEFKKTTDLEFNSDAEKGIKIEGKINTRSGILLGAGDIVIAQGAVLKALKSTDSQNGINFNELVNTSAASAGLSGDLNAVTDKDGDIIIRAQSVSEFTKTPISSQIYDTIRNSSNSARAEVAGQILSDGMVDVSANAQSTFDHTTWNLIDKFFNPTDISQNLFNKLGFNCTADWASKKNTASVTVTKDGNIRAGGNASLQADAGVSVVIRSATIGKKEAGTSTAIPVTSIAVADVENKAVVDVAGAVNSVRGDVSLAANAKAKVDILAKAETVPPDDFERANAIYLGVAWATGDNIAQIDVRDKKDAQGNSTRISAGGDFTAEAHSTTDMEVTTSVTGADETFFSTAVSVIDYDSAANVNIGRSVEAKSIKSAAENEVANMHIQASDGNGEGNPAYVGNADYVKWGLSGKTNGNTIAEAIKTKFGWTGVQNGGALQGFETAFQNIQKYITAGAGIAVVENSNTANVTVAPGVMLKATGPATEGTGNEAKPAGDITLSANTHMDSLHHSVTGVANKMDQNTASKFDVAAGVLYSKIENDAAVELQNDKENHDTGVTLHSVNGSVNLKAETVQTYDPLEPFKAIPDRIESLWKALKEFGYDYPELANLHSRTVTLKTQAENGTISEETARADLADVGKSFFTFINDQVKHTGTINRQIQKLIDEVSDIFSPASYTNYYVRSYMVDSSENKAAVAGSFNISTLHNKGIVSIGEKADISAGKNINVDATTDTNVVSATGNGGEYFAFSESNGSGVGASVAVQDFSGDSLILSGRNVSMKAQNAGDDSGEIAMNAANKMKQTAIILSAGKADNMISASGSLNALTGDINSLVLADDETTVNTAGTLVLTANNDSTVTNIVGGLALGSSKTNASVGAGVALNALGVNSIAVIGDNGTDAVNTVTDTETEDFKKKNTEEQNRIKTRNTLAAARKLAANRSAVKKMSTDFKLSDNKLSEAMGLKTADAVKGSLSAKDVYVTGNSGGTINAVALEGASNSENHSGFDTVNKFSKVGETAHNQVTDAAKALVNTPFGVMDRLFDIDNVQVQKTWDFSNLNPIQAPNNNPSASSFNAAVAGSVSWNKVTGNTAAIIDNVNLTLGNTAGSGKLLNAASDDVFIGAWSGAAAVNWFTGGAGAASNNNAHKGALGTALGVNNLKRDVKAVISNAKITGAGTIDNKDVKEGAEAAVALGIATTNDSQGTGTNGSVAFGLSLNKSSSDVHALLIDDTSSNSTGETTVNNSAYDGDVQVAGGVDIAYANSAANGRAVAAGIMAAVSKIDNNIQSGIQGGSYSNVKDMKVAGEDALTQVNAAVALSFTGSENGFAGTGALAYADLKNTNHSYVSGTDKIGVSGEVSVTSQDIARKKDNSYKAYLEARKVDPTGKKYLSDDTKKEIAATSGSDIVNVAVQITGTKTHAGGAAVTVGNVTNKFSSDITNNKKLEAAMVKGAADVHTNIVSVAAGVTVSTQNFGGAGSLSFNDIDQDNTVSITGNRNGIAENTGIAANTVSGTAKNTTHIVNVTGDFAGGKNAVGLGIAYNRMDDTTGVYAANNQIRAKDAATGVGVSLDADNDAYALALSLGAAATYKDDGTVAAHGNFGVNRGHNDTIAVIGEDKDGNHWEEDPGQYSGNWAAKDKITNASSMTVKATDETSKTSIAGSGELAIKPATVALGVGVALTESDKGTDDGNGKEKVRAEINGTDITTVEAGNTAPAVSAAATDKSRATTVAVGVGLARNAKFSVQGIGADARINKDIKAGLEDTTIDANGGSKAALVSAKADTSSTLKTGAAAMQLSGPDSFLAGVVAVGVNRIKDETTAGVTYTEKQTNTSMNVGNLDISAASKGDILSVAMGASAAVKGTAAAGGSGSHNYIENNVIATIEEADINSTGNVGVVARSDEAISNYAGVLDVGVSGQGIAAAVGVTGSYNKISGKTFALIDNSKVVAGGDNNNTIKTNSKLKENTDDEKYLIDSAVSRNTWSSGSFEEGEGDNRKYGVSRLQKGRQEEAKTGVVVDASATHSIASVMANGGVAVSMGNEGTAGSVAGVVNLNYVSGETAAKVLDSRVNENEESKRSDVSINAADYTNVAEFSGAASVGIGQSAGVAAGFTGTTNEIDRVAAAGVSTSSATWNNTEKRYETTDTSKEKNTIYAKNFSVTADAKQAMSAFNVTGAVAGSGGAEAAAFETGDNVNTNRMESSTLAMVTNAKVDYTGNAKVAASHEDRIYNLNVDAGAAIAASEAGVAGSLNVGVGVVNEESSVTANVANSDIKKATGVTAKSNLSVSAANKTTLEAQLVSVGVAAGLFSGGVASSIAVNNIDTHVTSRIAGSELTADTINIKTANELKVKDATGTGAGGLEAGIGVGVDVNTFNDTVSTLVDNSTVKANDTLSIDTETQRKIESTVAGVGIGGAGISVNVLAVTVNEGVKNLGAAKDGDGNDTAFSHTDTINKVLNLVNDHTKRELSEHFHGMTDDEKNEMKEKVKASAKNGNDVRGTGVHTYVQNNSTLEATNDALRVSNTELNDADLNGGSGSFGVAAINVADVVYHLNELNDISVQNSTVKGGSVSLSAHQGNVTKNKDDAIHLQTVQAGLGGMAIGAGYAGLTTKGQTGITVNTGTLTATKGDLTIKSSDDVKSKTDMVGVSAGALSVPVSVAHNYNETNNFVTVQGGSKLTATTDETRQVTDSNGNKTTEKVPASVSLLTERTGRVAAKTVGVGVGASTVIVNTAKVKDSSKSSVTVKDSGNTFTADAIRMDSTNAPVLKAEAGGTGVSAFGVAVMHSSATAQSQATVSVADSNSLLADTVLAQAVIGREGTDMTHAETHSTNVSAASIAPNKAKAITETTASVSMGKETYKTEKKEKTKNDQGEEEEKTVTGSYTNLALITQNNASRRAIIGNMSIGLLASIGTGDAKTEGNDKSLVEAKGGADDNEAAKLKNLKISAGGNNTAKGFADGDSGGITAWGAAATITMNTKTTNTASLSGAWDVAENADIGSLQQVTSKGTSKTGAGGILSVTWANSDNNVQMDTRTQLMAGTRLNAGQSYMLAANKVVTGAYDGETWNNHMNVGGVIQIAPDIKSRQDIKTNANVEIGKAASGNSSSNDPVTKVTTSKGQVFDAYSDLDLYNKVEGKGGGVAENIYTYSDAFVTSTNKITINEKAELEQKGEYENGSDITLSSSDKIKMNLAAEAYAGGLEGTVRALVDAPVTRNNSVVVNGKLSSTHDTNIYAGINADGTKSLLDVTALAEAHNNTVLPPYTSPAIELNLKNNQQVTVGNTGSATSVRNINVSAENGQETIKKDTVAVYWLFLGQNKDSKTATNTQGVSTVSEKNNNFVNVDGVLKTGIQNNVKIDITGALIPKAKGSDGQDYIPEPKNPAIARYTDADVYVNGVKIERGTTTDTIIKPEDIKTGDMDYATQLGTQLAVLEKLISDYSTDQDRDAKKTAAYLGYVQQRQRILDEMEKRGLFEYAKNEQGQYITDGNGNKLKVFVTRGFVISYVEIPDITVSGGNIVVQSDTLYGAGRLEANGAPRIEINNRSNAYLKLNNITVGEEGGDIRFRGTSLSAGETGKQQIRLLNKDTGKTVDLTLYSDVGNESAISVLNDNSSIGTSIAVTGNNQEWNYTSIPDVAVLGNINNSHGLVKIENKQGNITIGSGDTGDNKANVNGRTVQLIATQGSISQDYIDGIVNIGGRPQDLNSSTALAEKENSGLNKNADDHKYKVINSAPVQSDNSAGRIAGDSVYLAAADINVNGLIQSGYGKYIADIPEDALSDANIERMKNNGSEVTIEGRTMYKVNDGNKAVYDTGSGEYKYIIQVYYDPETKGLVVEDIDTKGGKIYLTGRISSTGNGRILAVDGGAEITITNNAKADLSVGKILNNDIEGKISITDLAKSTWTEYGRTATNSMSIAAYEKYLTLNDAYKADFAKLTDTQKVSYLNLTDTLRAEYADPQTTDARRAEILGVPTQEQIDEAKIVSSAAIGHGNGATPSGSYAVKDDLRYNWTIGEDTSTTIDYKMETQSLFWGGLQYGDSTSKLAAKENTTEATGTARPGTSHILTPGDFIGSLDNKYGINGAEFGAVMESVQTENSRTVTGSGKESGNWWALWSNPTYWVTWTTKTGATQSYTYSLKANKPIGVGFIGQKDGSISVTNTNTVSGNVNLDDNIQNNTKDATLTIQSAGGNIIQKSGTSLTTGHADLKAKGNIENVHITSMGERIAAGKQDAEGKEIYTARDGVKLSAVSYNGGNIDVDVVGGTAEGQKLPGNVVITKLASKGRQDATGKPGDVSLKAEGNITQFVSTGQRFTKSDGSQYAGGNAVQDYLADDAIYQGLPESEKQAYADKVTQEYNRFTALKQKFTGTGGAYSGAAEYLENDAVYKARLNSNTAYADNVKDEFAHKDDAGRSDLKEKFAGYNSAEEYLAQDKAYQDLLYSAATYKDNVEDEFARFTVEPVTVQGRSIRLTSINGGIGTFKEDGKPDKAVIINSHAEAYGLSEDTANVNAEAKGSIYLAEKEGDMRVGSIISHEGDVNLEAKDGRLIDALPKQSNTNNVDENDLIHHWIDAGLIAGTADYEGAYIKGLKQDAANYAARVEEQFNEFKSGGREISLRQKFTKPGSAETYSSAAEYLAQDKNYMVMENSSAGYKANIEYEFAHKEGNPDLEAKYANYGSAEAYLAQDTAYQNMLTSSKNYKDKTEQEFALFSAEESVRQKFTRTDGTYYISASEYLANDATYQQLVKDTQAKTNPYVRQINQEFTACKNGTASEAVAAKYAGYDTVSQFLLADTSEGGYLAMIKEQNDYEVALCDEFSRFMNNKSKGHLSDMFTLPSGKTYDSAAAYLRDDATYQAMVKKYEQPEFAWTKDQLLYAIRNAVVNKESGVSAETQTKTANVQGRNVTLVAQGIGVNTNQTTEISVSDLGGGTEASIAKMKQLANADAADVTMFNKNGDILRLVTTQSADGTLVNTWKAYKADNPSEEITYTDASNYGIDKFVIGNLSPLGVYATGQVDVTGIGDNVFIAGRSAAGTDENIQAGFSAVNVGKITAVGNDVRLYTQEGIYNTADQLGEKEGNIHAKDLIAYGGTKDIGTKEKPLTVSLSGDLLTANADGNVYIKNAKAEDKLRIGSVFAKDTVSLDSAAGFDMTTNPDYALGYLNAGKVLELKTDETKGEIGTAANPIRILNNAGTPEQYSGTAANNGMLINLKGKDGYVKGVNGTRGENTTMRLGLIEMTGDFTAASESYLEAGAIRLAEDDDPGINGETEAGGNVKLEAVKDVAVNGPVKSTEGNITIGAGAGVKINDKTDGVYANTGDISVNAGNDAEINGKVVARTGNITIGAEQHVLVKENATVETGVNDVTISGKEGITLDSAVKAGNPTVTNPDEVTEGAVPVYEGGGAIRLTSANGSIQQNENGALVSRSVAVTSGKAVNLTNTGNTFRDFMATGVETGETDEQGNKVRVINGGVNVSAHAGNTLTAGIDKTVVYGNVALTNLDAGGLTVNTDIVVKKNQDSTSGNIVFNQQGDILVEGALQAENSVSEISAKGNVTNNKAITADNHVRIQATAADAVEKGNIVLNGTVTANTIEGTAGRNITASAMNSVADIDLTAGNDVDLKGKVKTVSGTVNGNAGNDIIIEDTVTAPEHIVLAAGEQVWETPDGGLVTKEVNVTAGNNVGLTGDNNAFPRIIVNGITPEGGSEPAPIYQNVKIKDSTDNLSLNVNAKVDGLVLAENTTGSLSVDSGLKAGKVELRAQTDVGQQAEIEIVPSDAVTNGDVTVAAGNNIILENNNNKFNMITLQGLNTVTLSDEKGNLATLTAINGDVKVKTQAENSLLVTTVSAVSPEQLLVVGKDFSIENLHDTGGIWMVNGVAALGTEEDTGNVNLRAAGDIVNGDEDHTVNLFARKDINITSTNGGIENYGGLYAINDVNLEAANGIATGRDKDDNVSAGNSVNLHTIAGNIEVAGNVIAGEGDVVALNGRLDENGEFVEGTGNIEFKGSINAGNDVVVKAAGGNIATVNGTITAGQDITVQTGGDGNINLNSLGELTGTSVTAGNNISLTTEKGSVWAGGTITAENGDVVAVQNNGEDPDKGILFSGDVNALNGNVKATIRKTGSVFYSGNVKAGDNIEALVVEGGQGQIAYAGRTVEAGGYVTAVTSYGDITYENTVTAGKDITATTSEGNVTGFGNLNAGQDAVLGTRNGDVTLESSVTAERNVTVDTTKGNIEIGGNVKTTNGEVLLKAENNNPEESDGYVKVFGSIDSGTDTRLESENGDIVVAGTINSGENVLATVTGSIGNINLSGDVRAKNDVLADTAATIGGITVEKTVNAGNDVKITSAKGDINLKGDVDAGNDILANTTSGLIEMRQDVTAKRDIIATSEEGSIGLLGDIDAGRDVTAETGKNALILFNTDWSDGKHDVHAGRDVNLTVEDSIIYVNGKVVTDTGDVRATAKTGGIGFNGNIQSGKDITASVTDNGIISYNGTVQARNDVTATTAKGNIEYAKTVQAGHNVTALTNAEGNISVGDAIIAETGDVMLSTANGTITVGEEDGTGRIDAYGNVQINAAKADASDTNLVDILTSVESKNADVNVKTVNGNIHIGSNGPDTETVTAKENVTLEAVNGKIIIDGKTSTQDGDITLQASNSEYVEGEDGKNIIINQDGKIESGRDVNLIAGNGDLHVTGNVTARGTLNAETRGQGDISLDQDVTVVKDMVMQTETGDISVGKKVDAENGSVTMKTGTGDITVGEDVTAGNTVTLTTGDGDVTVGSNGKGSVTADKDVTVNVGTGDVDIVKAVTSENGSVSVKTGEGNIHIGNNGPDTDTVTAKENVTLETANGKITVDGKTSTQDGDITLQAANKEYVEGEDGKNIIINQDGKIESGHDVNLIAGNGDLHVTDNVKAQGTLNAETRGQGDISLDQDVTVVKDMVMQTETGDITVGKKVDAENGSVTMKTGTGDITVGADINAGRNVSAQTGTGDIAVGENITAGKNVTLTTGEGNVTVGSNGKGSVTADKDVTVDVGTGDVDIVKSVTSENGSVSARTGKGDIHIGNNGPDTDTVTAKKDVKLETDNGRIEIYGKTSAETGDITLKAANDKYVAGQDGQNIIISDNGKVESGRDVNLTARNGDLHVTDDIIAKRDIKAETQTRGDVFLDDDITVNRNLTLKADKGNITLDGDAQAGGSVRAETGKGNITASTVTAGNNITLVNGNGVTEADVLTAKNRINVANGNGTIALGTVDAASAALTNRGKNGHVTADTVRAEARGNSNGTGAEDIKLGGSHVAVGNVVNKGNGQNPLTISTAGASKDRAMKDFSIGTQNGDGSHDGGISSGSGAVIQQLWTDRGMIYATGKSNVHISKLVVNDKLHAANDAVSVAVYGRTPTHDGERMVYWNNIRQNDPGAMQALWYNRAYMVPEWMYLDLFYNGNVGSRKGVLVDAQFYRQIYGDSVSVVDTMRAQLEPKEEASVIAYFDRNNLVQIDDEAVSADSGDVTVE